MNKVEWVDSKITGGHWAFRTIRGSKAFQNPMREATALELLPSDVIIDIGAYVGEYSLWAANQNVKKVVSYEPTPATFALLKRNLADKAEVHSKAVVGSDDRTTVLHLSSGIGVTNSVVKTLRKAGHIEVPAIRYEDAVKDATVVKIDCEGAEYTFNILQPQLRGIVLEFHPIVGRDWRTRAYQIMFDIEAAGFEPIVRPTFKSGWSLSGCWVRNGKVAESC